MMRTNRRDFMKLSGGLAVAGAVAGPALSMPRIARASSSGRVVIIGGGSGGATCAHYLRRADPSIEVTLIEANPLHHTCYMSNEVLGGLRPIERIQVGYDGLRAKGVTVVHARATDVDPAAKTVKTDDGQSFAYDRLVVSPGIDMDYTAIDGYDAAAAETMPHAYIAGAQTALLRQQLEAMDNGGTFIIAAPPNPFRCPPGPYERACLVANYFKTHKPNSKILILDAKDSFSKQGLFVQAWEKFYGYGTDNSMIEWVSAAQQGTVEAVSLADMSVETPLETVKGAVINVIPPQKAGAIAFAAGLTEGKWCPVNKKTFLSTLHDDVHVIGDAAIATDMPKSGYSANVQGKITAQAIVAAFHGRDILEPSYQNTCYSIANPQHAFSVSIIYRYNEAENRIATVEGAGGNSPMDASDEDRRQEAIYAHSWYDNIVRDIWG